MDLYNALKAREEAAARTTHENNTANKAARNAVEGSPPEQQAGSSPPVKATSAELTKQVEEQKAEGVKKRAAVVRSAMGKTNVMHPEVEGQRQPSKMKEEALSKIYDTVNKLWNDHTIDRFPNRGAFSELSADQQQRLIRAWASGDKAAFKKALKDIVGEAAASGTLASNRRPSVPGEIGNSVTSDGLMKDMSRLKEVEGTMPQSRGIISRTFDLLKKSLNIFRDKSPRARACLAAAWENMGHTPEYLKIIRSAVSEIAWIKKLNMDGPYAVFHAGEKIIALSKEFLDSCMESLAALSMLHETAHAIDVAAAKAIKGFKEFNDAYASQHSDSPFYVGFEKTPTGVKLKLGPAARELLDAFRRSELGQSTAGNGTGTEQSARGVSGQVQQGSSAGDNQGHTAGRANSADQMESGKQQDSSTYSYNPIRPDGAASVPLDPAFDSLYLAYNGLKEIIEKIEAGEKLTADDIKALPNIAFRASTEGFCYAHELFKLQEEQLTQIAPQTVAFLKQLHGSTEIGSVARLLSGQEAVEGVMRGHTTLDMETTTPEVAQGLKESHAPSSVARLKLPGADGKPVALEDTERPVRLPSLITKPLPEAQQPAARDQLQSAIGKWITKGVEKLKDGANAAVIHLAPTTDLVRMAAKVMPTARKYWDALRSAQAAKMASEQDIDAVLNLASSLTKEEGDRVNRYLASSTLSGKWGYTPDTY